MLDLCALCARIEAQCMQQLNEYAAQSDLYRAMSSACSGPAKRIRPLLVYASGACLNLPIEFLDPIARAVEYIHTYSLVHDDLPDLDNDDERRGRPSCHRVFGTARALLAGDALQSLAFETVSASDHIPAQARVSMIHYLARAVGASGMAGGQDLDLRHHLDDGYRQTIHTLKTARLIQASLVLPTFLSSADDPHLDFTQLGLQLGLAFQIQDDRADCAGAVDPEDFQSAVRSAYRACSAVPLQNAEPLRQVMSYMFPDAARFVMDEIHTSCGG